MHEKYLLAALAEAQKGLGTCAPNPSVGAVAVKNDTIIARAWHRGAGTPHAEQLLIEQLPAHEMDVTLYVTLEPCNHQGRTPPCVNAIINYGFKRVVFAYRDPNPIVVENHTPNQLKEHSIDVIHHSMLEIDAFYQSYHFWTQTKKPWVTAKIAQTLDGKIAGPKGERIKLSNSSCETFTHKNRAIHDIILTTARTVNLDNPQMTVRLPGLQRAKPIAILDRQLSLNENAQIVELATHCHIFYDKDLPAPAQVDKRTYYPIQTVNGELCLDEVIQQLGYLGFHSVWVEAGGRLFTAIHSANLVQRTYIYLVPRILGEDAVSAYHHSNVNIFNQTKHVSWVSMGDNMVATLDCHAQALFEDLS